MKTLARDHVTCVVCLKQRGLCRVLIKDVNSDAKSVQGSYVWIIVAEAREQASKEGANWNQEYRRVQKVSLWRDHVWFEDFICAIVQWYRECVI
jgi:hypothetical protein